MARVIVRCSPLIHFTRKQGPFLGTHRCIRGLLTQCEVKKAGLLARFLYLFVYRRKTKTKMESEGEKKKPAKRITKL